MALRIDRIFSAAAGGSYYNIIVRQSDGYKYNVNTSAFEADPTAENAGIDVIEVGDTTYKTQIPDDISVNVDVVVYEKVGGFRDFTADTIIQSYSRSTGGIFGF